jgi:hypothetical protein
MVIDTNIPADRVYNTVRIVFDIVAKSSAIVGQMTAVTQKLARWRAVRDGEVSSPRDVHGSSQS